MRHNDEALVDFIAEAGLLKRVKRSGWWVVGIDDPENVAGHSFRCAVIGYVLARMEKADPYRVLMMTLFNDIHEARINDLHKMVQRYVDLEKAEDKAFTEQVSGLPGPIKAELTGSRKDYRAQRSPESIIARDADILECLIQAKEYYEFGHKEARKFMREAPAFLKTRTARKLWAKAEMSPINDWWEKLSSFRR